MEITVKSDIDRLKRDLDSVAKKQIPFVTSMALNATAWDARRAVQTNIKKKYILRNRWTLSGVRVRKSTKRTLVSSVFMAKGREYMTRQEDGGTIRPSGQHIAVPADVRKDKRRRITKARRPKALLSKPGTFRVAHGAHPTLPGGIYQRMKSGKLKLLYNLEKSVTIRKSFDFEKTVNGVVRSRFVRNFEKAMARAIGL